MMRRDLEKAALRGEPSYVWRDGQERRLQMILGAAGEGLRGRMLENGCGVGMYLEHLAPYVAEITGLEYDFDRAVQAHSRSPQVVNADGERLPFPAGHFDLILSHEVIEHAHDDRRMVSEMVRVLRPGGRLILFCPNRGYPFETHGVYWKGQYHFGNIPLVNYLPPRWRDHLAPHVRVYTGSSLRRLFLGLPVKLVYQTILFGAYDNIIARSPRLGKSLRWILSRLEKTPLRLFGLSLFWVIEKIE